jgi:hypothetical protein
MTMSVPVNKETGILLGDTARLRGGFTYSNSLDKAIIYAGGVQVVSVKSDSSLNCIGKIITTDTTSSTSSTTGALTVAGGVGVAGNVYVGGTINSSTWSADSANFNTLTAGRIYPNRIATDSVWHAYGGFQDSAITLDVTSAGVYVPIKNAAGTLWGGSESDGLSLSGDTMIVTNSGDYVGNVSITFQGANTKDFLFRIYNVTQARAEGYHIGATTTGAGSYANVALPIYLDVAAGDRLVIQVTCTTDASDPTIQTGLFYIAFLHH